MPNSRIRVRMEFRVSSFHSDRSLQWIHCPDWFGWNYPSCSVQLPDFKWEMARPLKQSIHILILAIYTFRLLANQLELVYSALGRLAIIKLTARWTAKLCAGSQCFTNQSASCCLTYCSTAALKLFVISFHISWWQNQTVVRMESERIPAGLRRISWGRHQTPNSCFHH